MAMNQHLSNIRVEPLRVRARQAPLCYSRLSTLFLGIVIAIALPPAKTAQSASLARQQLAAQSLEMGSLKERFEYFVPIFAAGQAITAVCPAYKLITQLEHTLTVFDSLAQEAGIVADLGFRLGTEMAKVALRYNVKGDHDGFCARILADHGPESSNPVVQLKAER